MRERQGSEHFPFLAGSAGTGPIRAFSGTLTQRRPNTLPREPTAHDGRRTRSRKGPWGSACPSIRHEPTHYGSTANRPTCHRESVRLDLVNRKRERRPRHPPPSGSLGAGGAGSRERRLQPRAPRERDAASGAQLARGSSGGSSNHQGQGSDHNRPHPLEQPFHRRAASQPRMPTLANDPKTARWRCFCLVGRYELSNGSRIGLGLLPSFEVDGREVLEA